MRAAWSFLSVVLMAPLFSSCATADTRESKPAPKKGKVIYIDLKNEFFVIDRGRGDGVDAELEFDIVRIDEHLRSRSIGTAVFEKYMGQDSMSKLRMQSGTLRDLDLDDVVFYHPKR